MRPEQWRDFKRAAKREPGAGVPLSLIVDSPWIPGYLGISHYDYYFDSQAWFEANLRIEREFPEIILLPSWWVELGMAIEPSAFGNRIHFHSDRTPDQAASMVRLEDVECLEPINPLTDGLMPLALHRYRACKSRIHDAGFIIPMVAARGPLCLAAFLRGVTNLMTDMVDQPDLVKRLLAITTRASIDWLTAQAEAIGNDFEGILVLDDIVGFLSPRAYREFAHPYLKQIADAFPRECVKVYHNDANVRPFLADLPDTGFDVLNWSHQIAVRDAHAKTGGRMCLMGNVPPLETFVRGTPEMVRESAREVIAASSGSPLILSVGGGVSPGTPRENLRALIEVART